MARQLARRQQRERIAGVLVVCLGLVVLAVAIIALREPNGHLAAAAASTASELARQSPSGPVPSDSNGSTFPPSGTDPPSGTGLQAVPLVVLNNSTIHGLALQATQQFEAGGWTVTKFGNYHNLIISTCAYYDPSDPTAKAAAEALQRQFPAIKRVEPKFPELPGGPVVVVLTGDYAST